ncbi:type II secretion system protein GspL [Lacisediminimonas sp.]|uniref:type II secretion system protein GspL n=1 Tax=Lacisediminimonas sp. TaxID=3060582 RepID=UPI002721128E|nr:type II secretion system protein GspL [Lacisediminimonas sp.]MDO8301226.1 type II secretion system protein GspL [Lacisediminimonas sp.]
MSTLYLRMPSKVAAESAGHWTGLPCPYAIASATARLEASGVEPLSSLAAAVAQAQRVVLILAASDVSLVTVQVPPMSPARLRAALPNLVEDQLISDPADCVLVAAGSGGVRTVAVVQRAWLDLLSRSVLAAGARNIVAVPAQLCLPFEAGSASAGLAVFEGDIDLAVRLSKQDGIGLPILPDSPASAADEVIDALLAIVPNAALQLFVPHAEMDGWRAAVAARPLAQHISLQGDGWQNWIDGAEEAGSLNLMSGVGMASAPAVNWRAWRLPLVLAGALLAVNVVGLQVDWWRMRSDADALRSTLTQIFRTAFPKEPAVDPVAQMRQKLAAAKRTAGESAPDDFLALAAGFGEAWRSSTGATRASGAAGATDASKLIAALDYKDRSLLVRFKPNASPSIEQMRSALAARALSVSPAPAQDGAQSWQIRSTR